jgi:hypothetical protein
MRFNDLLLEEIPEEDRPLCELILFTIERDINLYNFIESEQGRAIWADRTIEKVNRLTTSLLKQGVIDASYDQSITRMTLTAPLYIGGEDYTGEFDIEELRSVFSYQNSKVRGKMGKKELCRLRLRKWFHTNPGITMETVTDAASLYVKSCIQQNRTLKDCDNFILDAEGSTLSVWIEELANLIPAKEDEVI